MWQFKCPQVSHYSALYFLTKCLTCCLIQTAPLQQAPGHLEIGLLFKKLYFCKISSIARISLQNIITSLSSLKTNLITT